MEQERGAGCRPVIHRQYTVTRSASTAEHHNRRAHALIAVHRQTPHNTDTHLCMAAARLPNRKKPSGLTQPPTHSLSCTPHISTAAQGGPPASNTKVQLLDTQKLRCTLLTAKWACEVLTSMRLGRQGQHLAWAMAVVPRLDLQVAAIPGAASVQGADTQMLWLERRSSAIRELRSKAVLCMDSPGARKRPRACDKSSRRTHPQNSCTRHHTPQQICCSTRAHSTWQHTHRHKNAVPYIHGHWLPSCPNSPPPTPRRTSVGWPSWGDTAGMPRNLIMPPVKQQTHTPTQPIAASATRNTLDWGWRHKTVRRNKQQVGVEFRPGA